jgi:hypothetical protein
VTRLVMRTAAAMSITSVLTLAGCGVSTSEVVPVGRDSFMLTSTARGGLYAGQERTESAKAANQYCDALSKHMVIRRIDTNGIAGLGPVTSNLVFSCVTSDDPEYQRPNLRRDPNVVVEDRR